jgi:ribosomal subunit interface protein
MLMFVCMSFPSITIKGANYSITPDLSALVEHKLAPLGKFIPDGLPTTCEVELEKVAEHQSGKIYRAEINLSVNGKLYRAEGVEDQIEKAVDGMRDNIRHELQRDHERRDSLLRRGGRKIKQMLRFET